MTDLPRDIAPGEQPAPSSSDPARPSAMRRRRRLMPRHRAARAAVWLGIIVVYAIVMWYWVFPWVDETFVNQPAL